jgi:hypothetical protein
MLIDNGDGTFNIGSQLVWTSCASCGQRVTNNSIHTCSPQLRELSDEEIRQIYIETMESPYTHQQSYFGFARAILKKASEK